MELPPSPLIIERRVGFSQTDAAGLIHFTTYFTFMEAAEAELFRGLQIPLLNQADGCTTGFPRVDCQCQFRRPVSFDDLIRIELRIEELTSKRIHYAFSFFGPNQRKCAAGSMVTAYASREASGRMEAAEMPDSIQLPLRTWKNQQE